MGPQTCSALWARCSRGDHSRCSCVEHRIPGARAVPHLTSPWTRDCTTAAVRWCRTDLLMDDDGQRRQPTPALVGHRRVPYDYPQHRHTVVRGMEGDEEGVVGYTRSGLLLLEALYRSCCPCNIHTVFDASTSSQRIGITGCRTMANLMQEARSRPTSVGRARVRGQGPHVF